MHIEKLKTAGVKGLGYHCERLGKVHSNENIDPERTHLNFRFGHLIADVNLPIRMNNLDRLIKKHEENTGKTLRKDAPTVCSIVVTLPEQYKNKSKEQQDYFFKRVGSFLKYKFCVSFDKKKDPYCNVLWATVHYDETTPHMHFAFVPWHTKEHKISYKNVVNRSVYASLHTDLDRTLKKEIEWYKDGILLPDEKKRTRAYNLKDSQVLNAKLEERERELNEREQSLSEREKALDEREKAISKREENVEFAEQSLNELKDEVKKEAAKLPSAKAKRITGLADTFGDI